MWPFNERNSSVIETPFPRGELDELLRRVKAVERELDDLHAAYRRLRASKAAEVRTSPNAELDRSLGIETAPEAPPPGSRKNALRRQHLPGLLRKGSGV